MNRRMGGLLCALTNSHPERGMHAVGKEKGYRESFPGDIHLIGIELCWHQSGRERRESTG